MGRAPELCHKQNWEGPLCLLIRTFILPQLNFRHSLERKKGKLFFPPMHLHASIFMLYIFMQSTHLSLGSPGECLNGFIHSQKCCACDR